MGDMAFWAHAQENPAHVAVIELGGAEPREITAGELLRSANRIVHGLRALGLQRGDAIAAMVVNEAAMLELYLAATQAGLYITPINSHLAPPEVAYIVSDCEAKAVFCSAKTADVCKKALDAIDFPVGARFATTDVEGFRSLTSLKEGQPDTLPSDRRTGASMTYTSGTTGQPKGVRRPLPDVPPEPVASSLAMFLSLFGIQPHAGGVHLVVSPLYHTAVLNFATSHMHLGHTLVLMERWTPEGMLDAIARYRVTNTHMVPTQFRRLLALPEEVRARADVSSMRHAIHSAAPCPVDVKSKMLTWWGPVIYEYYAASEGGGTLVRPDEWSNKPGTVGKAWPISTIKIFTDDGRECAPREVGTVWMSMGAHKFEYHRDQKKTASSWRDGFFTVGDAGFLDEDGYLFLVDRKSDMIISGGVNIYPAEIEAVLSMHPRVSDVAVFGIPDDDWGEQVKAVIEPADGADMSAAFAEELIAFAKERLAAFKIPKTIDFTPQLPRDPNGKLYKRRLRDPYWEGRERAI